MKPVSAKSEILTGRQFLQSRQGPKPGGNAEADLSSQKTKGFIFVQLSSAKLSPFSGLCLETAAGEPQAGWI